MTLTLENITKENLSACLALSVEPWQERYISNVAESISWAYVDPENRIPLAVCQHDEPVGFLLFRRSLPSRIILLENFFMDRHHQSQGLGTEALRKFVELTEEMKPYERLYYKVAIGDSWGRSTLEKSGFMRGAFNHEERAIDMVYILQ